jgi:hypothetical protein
MRGKSWYAMMMQSDLRLASRLGTHHAAPDHFGKYFTFMTLRLLLRGVHNAVLEQTLLVCGCSTVTDCAQNRGSQR